MLSRLATREVTRIYQIIASNHALLNLWREENLLKPQKLSKYYDHGCLQKIILHFMYLLTVSMLKTVIFWLEFILSF